MVPDPSIISEAWRVEREAYRSVVRWRALYSRCRPRMRQMDPQAAIRLHYRLKDLEYEAIEGHRLAEQQLLELGGLSLITEDGVA